MSSVRTESGIKRESAIVTTESPVRRDAYYWRLAATGLSFALFGLGALVLGLIVFPLLRLVAGSPTEHRRRARATVRRSMALFTRIMRALGVLTYEAEGIERLGRRGQLIVANHPTLIDVVFLLSFVPDAGCVVKRGLWRNPFTRWPAVAAGYVANSPTDRMIAEACTALAGGQSVIIFPEGTRTVPGQRLQFHRGAAHIAVKAAEVVTPVLIRSDPPTLAKGAPWYRVPHRRVRLSFQVGEDIDPASFRQSAPPLASRAFNAHLLQIFETSLERPDRAT